MKSDFVFKLNCVELYKNGQWPETPVGIGQKNFWEGDGFVLLYKRLESGRFQWPRKESEVRKLSEQELRWLLEGLSINQPKAV